MIKTIQRYISFLLVLMLVVTMLPTAFAAEVSGDSTTTTEETLSETTLETTVSTIPEENADVSQPPPDETGESIRGDGSGTKHSEKSKERER